MKQILIINAHPRPGSYNESLADQYEAGAKGTEAEINRLDLGKLEFDPNLKHGYHQRTPHEPDLERALALIRAADHIVWVFPIWWYSYPAIMKGFIDRIFLPGIAFKYKGNAFPEKLWKGKTARLIVTSDTPYWYQRWVMRNSAIHAVKKGTLQFCGISPVKLSYIAIIRGSSEAFRQKWLQRVYALGKDLK
ncbi:MAG: NAD(P)H-dependent oxidoreductase [Bacteroidota bacterium]